jgi:hypothetical protein
MFRTEWRDRRGCSAARTGALAAVLLAACAAVGAAQVKPPPNQSRAPARPDLVITGVDFQEVLQGTPVLIARVSIKNQGGADAVLGGRQVDATGQIYFSGNSTLPAITLKPGELHQVGLTVHLCGAQPNGEEMDFVSPVQFRVDPDQVVAESNEANNALTVTLPLSIVRAAPSVRYVRLRSPLGPAPRPPNDSAGWSYLSSDLVIHIQNTGTGPALWCASRAIVKEVSTPVPPQLRSVVNATGQAILIPAGGEYVATLADEVKPNKLAPGSYTWSLQLIPWNGLPGRPAPQPTAHVVRLN